MFYAGQYVVYSKKGIHSIGKIVSVYGDDVYLESDIGVIKINISQIRED